MTAFQAGADYGDGRREEARRPAAIALDHSDPESKRIIVGFGFWIFLLSDIIMFSAFFATYAVLSGETAGGPSGKDLFRSAQCRYRDRVPPACRVLPAAWRRSARERITALCITAAWPQLACSGLGFLAIEIHEFVGMIAQGAGPTRSAFLSAFFTLVGCHGVHVTLGILWLLTMVAQVFAKGYRADILRRVLCFALFWHTLDIIWVAIFTVVYLFGAGA